MDQTVAEDTRLRLYMTLQDKWVQIGWVEEREDAPTELEIIEDIDHKTALSNMIASALMNHPLEFRVVDYEIKEDDPVLVTIHIVNNDEDNLALCTGEYFNEPLMVVGTTPRLCPDCHKMAMGVKDGSND